MKHGISIITAVHNAYDMNQFYWEMLSENTTCPFELIVIDNHSTDGTETYFESLSLKATDEKRVVYVRNEFNQPYPQSMNQAKPYATYEVLGFLNNDIWMPKNWQQPFFNALDEDPLLVLSPSGQEAQPSQSDSDALKRRWKRVVMLSRLWKSMLAKSEGERLRKSLSWMYGEISNFVSPTKIHDKSYMIGIKGDVVVMHKKLLSIVPEIWDERFEAADWHLYLSLAALHQRDKSIPLPRVLLNVYAHHFGRYSAKLGFEPMRGKDKMISIEQHWSKAQIQSLWWG